VARTLTPALVAELWNWLPAFRVVAETQHLPTASRRLHVSASALSRSIRLVEDRVGKPLFRRDGGKLVLNEEGQRLLEAVCLAMSEIGGRLDELAETTLAGALRVSAPSAFVPFTVVPALRRLLETHTGLVPMISSLGSAAASDQLVDGRLDVALLDDPVPRRHLRIERLMTLRYGVYCGLGHPLAGAPRVGQGEILAHPFVAPPDLEDHWPSELPRRIGLHVTQLAIGVELCAGGEYLAVLPDAIAERHRDGPRLHRLPLPIEPDTALFAIYREKPEAPRRTEILLAALRAVAGDVKGS
jgi:DNA-binding transcriptional LysR family regulator